MSEEKLTQLLGYPLLDSWEFVECSVCSCAFGDRQAVDVQGCIGQCCRSSMLLIL